MVINHFRNSFQEGNEKQRLSWFYLHLYPYQRAINLLQIRGTCTLRSTSRTLNDPTDHHSSVYIHVCKTLLSTQPFSLSLGFSGEHVALSRRKKTEQIMASSTWVFANKCRALMAAAKSSAAAATPAPANPQAPARAAGILKVHTVSPALAEFLGSPEASRSVAIKKIWEYIKSNNLQVQNLPCTAFINLFHRCCFYAFNLSYRSFSFSLWPSMNIVEQCSVGKTFHT